MSRDPYTRDRKARRHFVLPSQIARMALAGEPLPAGYAFCKGCKKPRRELKDGCGCCKGCHRKAVALLPKKPPRMPPPVVLPPPPVPLPAREEARQARARQLAAALKEASMPLWALLRQGWTPGALDSLLVESPEWFACEGGEAAMAAAFADACIDSEPLRLAKEAGRLEALRWAMKGRRPQEWAGGWWWWQRTDAAFASLKAVFFDLLEGGTLETNGGRCYASRALAMADLAQALRRLSREGFSP